MSAVNPLLGTPYGTRQGTRAGAPVNGGSRSSDVLNKDIDGTPLCLGGIVLGAVALLAFFKITGFRMVIGVGGS